VLRHAKNFVGRCFLFVFTPERHAFQENHIRWTDFLLDSLATKESAVPRFARMHCSITRCLFKKRNIGSVSGPSRDCSDAIPIERSQAQTLSVSVSSSEYSPLGGLIWTPRLSACSFATATLQRTFFSISDSVRSDVFCRVTRRPAVPAQVHFPCDQKRNRRVCRHREKQTPSSSFARWRNKTRW